MADDQIGARRDQPFLWTRIFSGFKVALDPKKLLLAAAGILLMAFGWWFLAVIFYGARSEPKEADYPAATYRNAGDSEDEARAKALKDYQQARRKYDLLRQTAGPGGTLRTWPFSEDRGPNPFLVVERAIERSRGTAVGETGSEPLLDRRQVLFLVEPLVKFLAPVAYLFHPDAGFWNGLYFCLVIICTLAVWALFGGAITRMAAVQVARNEKIGMTEAVRFTAARYFSFLFAPVFPLLLVALLAIFLLIFGFFQVITVFFGDILIAGLLWPLVLLFGLVMAVVLVGLVGWPLMYATISAEGSDSFDALSRSYSYVYQAPWHYLWYGFLAIVYGAVVVFFIGFMGSLMVYLGKWGVSHAPLARALDREPAYLFVYTPTSFQWRKLLLEGTQAVYTPEDVAAVPPATQARIRAGKEVPRVDDDVATDIRDGNFYPGGVRTKYLNSMSWWNRIGAILVAFWIGLVFLLVVGFGYSYFWSVSTIIYLLMRRKVDDTELDEVHLEEDDLEEPYAPAAPSAPAPAPAKGPAGGTLIPPESLTLRTPEPAHAPATTPVTGGAPPTMLDVTPAPAKPPLVEPPSSPVPPPPAEGPRGPAGGDGNPPV